MKSYNPENPALTLKATLSQSAGFQKYNVNDNTGLGPNGVDQFISYSLTLSDIQTQTVGDTSLRHTTGTGVNKLGVYNGIDVKVGDYIATTDGGRILKIVSISEKNTEIVKCIGEDTGMTVARTNSTKNNSISQGATVVIFEVNDDGHMVLAMNKITDFENAQYLAQIENFFRIYTPFQRFTLYPENTGSLQLGDFITITGSGTPYTLATASQDDTVIGVVADLYGGNNVNIRPFNKIVTNFDKPELVMNGEIGTTWYLSGSNYYTTSSGVDTQAKFFQITDSRIGQTTGSYHNPNLNQTQYNFIINGVEVIPVDSGGSTLTLDQITGSINTSASVTFTSASVDVIGGSNITISTGGSAGTGGANGTLSDATQLAIYLSSTENGGTGDYPSAPGILEITHSLGGSETDFEVHFTKSNFEPYNYPAANEEQISFDIATAASTAGVSLSASFGTNTLNVIAQDQGTIILKQKAADAFGVNLIGGSSGTGLPSGEFAPDAEQRFLTLFREDGGDVLLSGSWLDQSEAGGLFSFSGTPPFLLMLEGGSISSGGEDNDWYIGDTFLTSSKDVQITGSLLVNRQDNTSNFFLIQSSSYDALKIDSEGITRFFAYANEDNPWASADYGGIYYMSSSVWVAID